MRLTRVVRIFKMSKNFQGLIVLGAQSPPLTLDPSPSPSPYVRPAGARPRSYWSLQPQREIDWRSRARGAGTGGQPWQAEEIDSSRYRIPTRCDRGRVGSCRREEHWRSTCNLICRRSVGGPHTSLGYPYHRYEELCASGWAWECLEVRTCMRDFSVR